MFSKEITTTAEDYRTLVKFTEYSLKKSNNILFITMAVLAVASLVIGLAGIIPLYISAAVCLLCTAVILADVLIISKKAKDGIKYGKVVLNAKRTFSGIGKGVRRKDSYRYKRTVGYDFQNIRDRKVLYNLFQI